MKFADLLLEAINYEDMFSKLISIYEENNMNASWIKNTIKEVVSNAKKELKREDRIVWYLRHYKIYFITNSLPQGLRNQKEIWSEIERDLKNTAKKANVNLETETPRTPTTILNGLAHFLSLPVPEIQNFVFKNQSYQEIWGKFYDYEAEWKSKTKGLIAPKDGDEIVVKFDDNTAWWLLARGACKEEAEAMGHCGNVPSQRDGERILSFRTKKLDNMWQPHLTFILDKDGRIGESKGKGNDKPAEKYHPYIAKLLMKADLIKGLKGGGYRPENNFKLSDLDDELKEKVLKANPEIKNASMSIWEKYKQFGLTGDVKREAENIIYDSRLDSSDIDFDEDGKYVVVARYNDLERFVREIDFELLNDAVKVLAEINDEKDLDEMQERFYPVTDDYLDILERLPDEYLNKVKKSVDYSGKNLRDLADLMYRSKYDVEFKKAMIDAAIPGGKNFDKKEYIKYINILLGFYTMASDNYYATIEEISSEDDYIVVKMPVDNFIMIAELVEYDRTHDDLEENEHADEEERSMYYSIMNMRDWLPVDNYNLNDNMDRPDDYIDDDDYEIFKKYKTYKITDDEVTGVSQNFDIRIAVKYFTQYIDLNESLDMSRLKKLAGI